MSEIDLAILVVVILMGVATCLSYAWLFWKLLSSNKSKQVNND